MAYSIDDIERVDAYTAASYAADDAALDVELACMLNGTTGEDCDEWKEGTINGRVEIAVPPSAITAMSVRFYLNSIMTAGNNSLLPYTDVDSVDNTDEDTQDYSSAGQWIEHASLSAGFLADLGDLGLKCAVRLASNDGAKSKIGEVNADVTYTTLALAGVTKDKDGVALGSCEVALFQVVSQGPPSTYSYIEPQTSNAVTGAYSFTVFGGIEFMVYSIKDDTPHVFDASDNVLEGA